MDLLGQLRGSPWIGAVGCMLGFVWEAFWLIGPPIGIAPNQPSYLIWGLAALAVCAFQSFHALNHRNNDLRQRLREIEDSKPRIKPKSPSAHTKMVGHQFVNRQTNQVIFTENVPFLCVSFHNDPPNSFPKSIAKGVRAFIEFTPDGKGSPILSMDGRWAESSQPPAFGPFDSKAELLEISFGLGESHILDIAYISAVDSKCYAWNNDNYENYDNKYVTPKHCLPANTYRVKVRLRGELVDEVFNFAFTVNQGGFTFTELV